MGFHKYFAFCLSLIFSLGIAANVLGGQVISEDAREWARSALQSENSIQAPTGRNTIAVLYFKNKTGTEGLYPLQKGIALLLITDLAKIKDLQVVERIKLQALTEELGLGTAGLVEPGSAPRTGKLLGARWLVGGDFSGTDAQLQVQSSVMDVPAGNIVGQPAAEAPLAELFRLEKALLFDIVKLLKIEVSPELENKLRKPCSIKTDALFALFAGVDASDRKDYEKAADLYKKALKEDPNICLAADSLGELQTLGLISKNSRSRDLIHSLRDSTSLTDQLPSKDEIKRIPTPSQLPSNTDINVVFPGR